MTRAESTRSCAGCREKGDRDVLLRFVLAGEPPAVVPDVRRRGPGRGVSVHPRRQCLNAAVRSGAFRRAFKRDVQADAGELAQWASGQYDRRIDGLLVAAYRTRKIAVGAELARNAIRDREASLLVVAEDARGDRECMRMAGKLGSSCLVHANRDALGALFGRASVAIVAVTDPSIAKELQVAARCVAELAEAS